MGNEALGMMAVLAAALSVFGWSVVNTLGVLAGGRKENRLDNIGARMAAVFEIAIAQKKMFKDPVYGPMHALIFWGFLVLSVRSLVLIIMAFFPEFHLPGAIGNGYTASKDVFELLVLMMVSYGAYRRLFSKPERITPSMEGVFILGMIGTLMITDFLFDGSRIAMMGSDIAVWEMPAAEAEWAVIGSVVGQWLHGTANETLLTIESVSYWIHIVTLFVFLNLLPHSKHMHVLSVIPNVFFLNLGSPGKLSDMDLEDETAETFGAGRAEDLTWKQMLDLYTCTECGRCSVNCPAWNTDKPLNPKMLIKDLQYHMKAVEDRLKGKVTDEEMPPATEEGQSKMVLSVNEDVIWSCTTCRSCEENCPVMISHVDKIVDLRRYLVLTEAQFPKELNPTFRNLEQKGNPWGLPVASRGDWVDDEELADIPIPHITEKMDAEVVFWVGCAGAYDDRQKKVTKAMAKILSKGGVSFAILAKDETCTGDPARRAGNEYLFQMLAQQNIDTLNKYNVRKIVTHCPHCLNTMLNEYPSFGGHYEVVHHTQLINDLVAEGRITPTKELDKLVVYHDSCYLGRYNEVYDAPRNAVSSIPGTKLVEMERSKENGMCCGAGGSRIWMEENIGSRVNHLRVEQAMEVKPDIIASGCPFCLTMLKDGAADKEAAVETRDIAELVAESLES